VIQSETDLAASSGDERPIRVLHVITRMIVGGAQENTLLSVEGLDRMPEYEVTLASGVDKGQEGSLLDRARANTRVVVVDSMRRGVNPLRDIRAFVALYRLIRKGDYDIVHTHSTKAGVLGRLAAALAGIPVVVHTLHSLVYHDFQPRPVNWLLRQVKKALAPLTDHYICVARAIQDKAIADGIAPAAKFSTIYSGMELDWFLEHEPRADLREDLGIPDEAVVIGKVARLFPLKGHAQLLEAAPDVCARNPKVVFLLVGGGPLTEGVLDQVRRHGIEEHFILTGLVPRDEVPEYIAAMDILVHTSLREGLARVLPQALAMQKPCVAVDLDGAPEVVVDDRTGYLVPPNDGLTLAKRLSDLAGDTSLCERLGAAGPEVVDPRFRSETMVADIASVYGRLMRSKRGGSPRRLQPRGAGARFRRTASGA
jgi:glycosyltransferase involved in cell wall biosynthesis